MGNDCCAFLEEDEEQEFTEAELLRQKSGIVDLHSLVRSKNHLYDTDIWKSRLTRIVNLSRREGSRYALVLKGYFPDFEQKRRPSLSGRRRTASLLSIKSAWDDDDRERENISNLPSNITTMTDDEKKKDETRNNTKNNGSSNVNFDTMSKEEIWQRQAMVIKQYSRKEEFDAWNRIQFENDIIILKQIGKHPHCISFVDTYIDSKFYYLGMQFCRGGSLLDNIVKLDKISEQTVVNIIKIILDVLKYVHSKDIVHRNLCFQNLVYSDINHGRLTIIGWDDACIIKESNYEPSTNVQTPSMQTPTMSPEQLNKRNYHDNNNNSSGSHHVYDDFVGHLFFCAPECFRYRHGWELKKIDLWAVGVITFMLIFGVNPFSGESTKSTVKNILRAKIAWPHENKRQDDISIDCKQFILKLINKIPLARHDAKKIINDPWLNGQDISKKHLGYDLRANLTYYNHASWLRKLFFDRCTDKWSKVEQHRIISALQQLFPDRKYIKCDDLTDLLYKFGLAFERSEEVSRAFMESLNSEADNEIILKSPLNSHTQKNLLSFLGNLPIKDFNKRTESIKKLFAFEQKQTEKLLEHTGNQNDDLYKNESIENVINDANDEANDLTLFDSKSYANIDSKSAMSIYGSFTGDAGGDVESASPRHYIQTPNFNNHIHNRKHNSNDNNNNSKNGMNIDETTDNNLIENEKKKTTLNNVLNMDLLQSSPEKDKNKKKKKNKNKLKNRQDKLPNGVIKDNKHDSDSDMTECSSDSNKNNIDKISNDQRNHSVSIDVKTPVNNKKKSYSTISQMDDEDDDGNGGNGGNGGNNNGNKTPSNQKDNKQHSNGKIIYDKDTKPIGDVEEETQRLI